MFRKTYLKINLNSYFENIETFKKITNKKIMPVIKANAYGTVDYYMALKMEKEGIDFFAVSSLEEALRLRKHGVQSNILILELVENLDLVKKYNLSVIAPHLDYIKENVGNFSDIRVHIKINTGLNRLGLFPNEVEQGLKILLDSGANVEGVMTHFACNDNHEYTYHQYQLFKETVEKLNYNFKYIHTSASDAALYLNDTISNYTRIGLGLLGFTNIKRDVELKNVLSLISEVIYCKKVQKGEGVSYSHKYISDGEGYINTIAIGYADGVSRDLEGKEVLVGEEIGTVVGTVCMDTIMVKTKSKHNLHEPVEIIGNNFTIERRKDELKTCCCKVICDIQDRVTRIYEFNNKIIDEINLRD